MPTAPSTVFTGKVELGQGIVTALAADRGRRARPAARARHDDLRRYRRTPRTKAYTAGSQSIEIRRHRAAAWRRRGARHPARSGRQSSASPPIRSRSPTASSPRLTAARSAMASWRPTLDLKREATAKVAPKPPAQHKIVGQSIPRLDIPAKVTGGAAYRAGHAAARHGAWPRGAAAALWRQARQRRRRGGQGDARRHRGGARRQLSRRRRASARSRRSRRARR